MDIPVWYRITISIIILCEYEILADFNLMVAKTDHQTAKFNSSPSVVMMTSYTFKFSGLSSIFLAKLPKVVNMDEVNMDELQLADSKEESPPPIPPRCN